MLTAVNLDSLAVACGLTVGDTRVAPGYWLDEMPAEKRSGGSGVKLPHGAKMFTAPAEKSYSWFHMAWRVEQWRSGVGGSCSSRESDHMPERTPLGDLRRTAGCVRALRAGRLTDSSRPRGHPIARRRATATHRVEHWTARPGLSTVYRRVPTHENTRSMRGIGTTSGAKAALGTLQSGAACRLRLPPAAPSRCRHHAGLPGRARVLDDNDALTRNSKTVENRR
jgi:hypothetical protein